jgi:fluoride exporter
VDPEDVELPAVEAQSDDLLRVDHLPVDPDLAPDNTGEPSTAHRAGQRVHRSREIRVLAAIAGGGFLGALARYEVTQLWAAAPHGFPWAVFTINTSGSFALAVVLTALLAQPGRFSYIRPFFCVGFLGAWTTMSTFAIDVDLLVRAHQVGVAIAYVIATVVVGPVSALLGTSVGRRVSSRRVVW